MDISTILLRFLITFVLAALFGFERQRTHKPVGFGTFMFIAIGSCALTTVPLFLGLENPVPLFAAVVTSIGFLVAGALIRTGDKTFGFTTAASIWTFAILGLTIGLGAYLIAGITYILIWLVILIDFYFEKKGMGSYQQKLTITAKLASQKEVNSIIKHTTLKHKLMATELDKNSNRFIATYIIEGTKEEINKIPKILQNKPWFLSCRLE
ncbi:MAG TPA: MgtC/SapB family protein [Candidatus Nanoarchaeia archaeon]|nr:MgtC/SapB family protein [Candidatus Nanoarchaeia archaeon]